jgi:hypothetical protein
MIQFGRSSFKRRFAADRAAATGCSRFAMRSEAIIEVPEGRIELPTNPESFRGALLSRDVKYGKFWILFRFQQTLDFARLF